MLQNYCVSKSVAGGGVTLKSGCEKLLFGQFFPKDCKKLKEFGTGDGGGCPWRPLRSANANLVFYKEN